MDLTFFFSTEIYKIKIILYYLNFYVLYDYRQNQPHALINYTILLKAMEFCVRCVAPCSGVAPCVTPGSQLLMLVNLLNFYYTCTLDIVHTGILNMYNLI